MNTLSLYRSGNLTVTVDIDEKTYFSQKIMSEHRITSEFYTSAVLDIQIGDYVSLNNEDFFINRLPTITKIGTKKYQYHIDFESVMYDLAKKLFISIDGLAEYGRTGSATDFIGDIVTNMNVISSDWTVGTIDSTDEKTLVFSNESCRSALTRVAEAFALEFSLTGKSISLVKSVGSVTSLTFEYGRFSGLYKLERQQVSDQNIITKVYGFGSMTNIPFTYRNKAKRLIFSTDGPYTSPPSGFGGGDRFLTKNTEVYGTIEGQYTNDDIYPNRTGTITAVNQAFVGDKYSSLESYVEDSSIDFDISVSKIEGASGAPSIVFKSGDLAGIECEIWKYDNVNKRIYFNPYTEEDGYTRPNPLNVAKALDTYTLVNIALPQSYIDTAEEKLLNETVTFLNENCVPMVVYSVEVDPKFAKNNTIALNAGDRVTVVDVELSINSLIRVSAIEYPLTNVYKIKATIADSVPYTKEERVIQTTVSTSKETRYVDRTSDELTRRHTTRMQQLRDEIFDADGYFDGTRIKPLSVETMYLSVGSTSTNFHLNGVKIKPNWSETYQSSDPNGIYISPGELVHHVWKIGEEYTWIIGAAASYSDLDPDTAYYLYAKISKTALTGEWLLSSDKYATDNNDGYYYLVCGILYAVLDGLRDFDFTYGMSYINGRILTTGKVQTINQLNFLDLDTNQFKVGDGESSLDWNVTKENQLTLVGAMVQRDSEQYFPITVFRGAFSGDTVYHYGDMAIYNNRTWIFNNQTPTAGQTPVEGEYWSLTGAVGEKGDSGYSPIGIYRGDWSIGTDYYGTPYRVDIVKLNGVYYVAKSSAGNPFRGMNPEEENSAYWSQFGASFTSVATSLLFSELAYIDKLGVHFFEGLPVGVGTLAGTVDATQENTVGTQRVDRAIIISGTSGSANIRVSGVERLCTWTQSRAATAAYFVSQWTADYLAAGVLISHGQSEGVDDFVIYFTEVNGENFTTTTTWTPVASDISGQVNTMTAHADGQQQIDTITLSGTGGVAEITCDQVVKRCVFFESLANTALKFANDYYNDYLAADVLVSADGSDIIFTSRYKSQPFVGDTTITNIISNWAGAISIAGNEIWEDKTNSDQDSGIMINLKGYQGGTNFYRNLSIGDGKGNWVVAIGGSAIERGNRYFRVNAPTLELWNLPTDPGVCYTDQVYRDANGFLKIK